jgi:hypothetical protein
MNPTWETYEKVRAAVPAYSPDWRFGFDGLTFCNYILGPGACKMDSPPSLSQLEGLAASGLFYRLRVDYRGERIFECYGEEIAAFVAWRREYRVSEVADALRKVLKESKGK